MKFTTISDEDLNQEVRVILDDLVGLTRTIQVATPYSTSTDWAMGSLRWYVEMRKVDVKIKQSAHGDATIWDVTLKDSREEGSRSWRAVGTGLNQPTLARAICLAIVNHWYDGR